MELVTETRETSSDKSFCVSAITHNRDGKSEEMEVLSISVISYSGGGLRVDFDPGAFNMIRVFAGKEMIYRKNEAA